jgi:hypothetical protein
MSRSCLAGTLAGHGLPRRQTSVTTGCEPLAYGMPHGSVRLATPFGTAFLANCGEKGYVTRAGPCPTRVQGYNLTVIRL